MDSIKANFRVVKERGAGHTEVFVTATKPALNFSMYLPEDSDVETGQYELSFKRIDAPAKEAASTEKETPATDKAPKVAGDAVAATKSQ